MGAFDGGRGGGGGEDEAHPAIIAEVWAVGISSLEGRGERGAMGRKGMSRVITLPPRTPTAKKSWINSEMASLYR